MAGGGAKTSTTNANTSEDRLFVYTNLVLACNPPPSLPVSLSLSIYTCVCACNSVLIFFDSVENLSREKEGSQKRDRSGSVRQEG